MKNEKIYLERLLKTIEDIENYLWNDKFENFIENQMQIDASIMKLQVLWENIKKIWVYEWIPYKDIIWLRDWISHDYFWLDLEIIWETLKKDIPNLKRKIIHIYESK
jgi:uncharacterized protein with HEPN domain